MNIPEIGAPGINEDPEGYDHVNELMSTKQTARLTLSADGDVGGILVGRNAISLRIFTRDVVTRPEIHAVCSMG
jgi:hypothetical protein